MNKITTNNAVEIVVSYLVENGKSTAEKIQDEIAKKMEIEPGTMNELYESVLSQMEEEVIVDFTGVQLKN